MAHWLADYERPFFIRSSLLCVGAFLLFALSSSPAAAETLASSVPSVVPFAATVKPHVAYLRLHAKQNSPEIGFLRKGAIVTVTDCAPDCATKGAWAILGSDGALKLSLLRWGLDEVSAPVSLQPEQLQYGRTDGAGSKVYQKPELGSRLLSRRYLPQEMAFVPNPELQAKGWLQRVDGGFVRARLVKQLPPSTFRGEANPSLPIAFVLHELGQKKDGAITDRLHRYERLPVQRLDGTRVTVDKGTLPRHAVRVIRLRSPPPILPIGARWVVVDLAEQTLTAYEGTRPVLATLVSTGTGSLQDRTKLGLYEVQHKMLFSNMRGKQDSPYVVDRVPYTIYYDKNEAIHGAYWHDSFGIKLSHGCVNLSLADAKWLFDWSPPQLPAGWSEIEPKAAGLTSLWVLIASGVPDESALPTVQGMGRPTYSRVSPLANQRDRKK